MNNGMKYFRMTMMVLMMGLALGVQAQDFPGLDKSPMDAASYSRTRGGKVLAKVVYSRPQLNGREVAKLAPAGKVWRTGANEATEITFFQDVDVEGTPVAAGTYSVFTIPGDGEWTLILNREINQWGAYRYSADNDVVRITAPTESIKNSVEAFAMKFDENGHLMMAWGTTKVAFPINF